MKNTEKLIRYQYIMKRLDEAIDKGFDIQAIAYIYALIEDRFNSFLIYAKMKSTSNKVKDKIKLLMKTFTEDANLHLIKLLSKDLINQVMSWIDDRNKIMHGMAMMTLDQEYIKTMAKRGRSIVLELNQLSPKIKRLLKKPINNQ